MSLEIKGSLSQYSVCEVYAQVKEQMIWFGDCAHGFDICSVTRACECICCQGNNSSGLEYICLICDQRPIVCACVVC